MDDETPPDNPHRATILAIAACALLIRVAFVVVMADSLNADPDAYRAIAENLRQNGIYGSTSAPTAFRPPLYPVLLAGLTVGGEVTPVVVGGLHVLLGVATVVLTFLLARQWRLGRWSFVAAAFVAIDPILLNQSALVMTETLATLLATAGLLAMSRWSAKPSSARTILAGVVFGLACLCRPTFIPWLGLSTLVMVLRQRPASELQSVSRLQSLLGSPSGWLGSSLRAPSDAATGGSQTRPQPPVSTTDAGISVSVNCPGSVPSPRRAVGQPIAFVLAAMLVVAPWACRNYYVFGVPKATTTHGGYTILLGNNPSFYRYLSEAPRGTTWDATELAAVWELRRFSASPNDALWTLPHTRSNVPQATRINRTEFADDEFAYSLARRYIADEPGMFVYSCCVRVSRLWQVIPYQTSTNESAAGMLLRVVTGCWYSGLFVLAIVGIIAFRSAKRRSIAERIAAIMRSPIVWGLLLCFAFTAVHALYWSNMRMRAPLIPFLCLLATNGVASVSRRINRRKP